MSLTLVYSLLQLDVDGLAKLLLFSCLGKWLMLTRPDFAVGHPYEYSAIPFLLHHD